MKNQRILFQSICLILVLLLFLPQVAYASANVRHTQVEASPTLRHGSMYLQNAGGAQAAQYLYITPGADLRPIVSSGGTVFGANNLNTIVQRAASAGHNVLGGINADFFAMSTGVSEGLYISNGRLKSSHHGRSAIFFNEDGSGFVSRPTLSIRLQNVSNPSVGAINIPFLNKTRLAPWPVLYDQHFANTTRTQDPGREVLFRVLTGVPNVGGTVMLEVVDILNVGGQTALHAGYMTLSADLRSPYLGQLDHFSVGDQVRLDISANDTRINSAAWGVGGGDILVENGVRTSGWDPGIGGRHPRTAIGFAADGSVIFYVADGRQAGRAAGLTLGELADELVRLGARYVVNLDGGGSTTFSYRMPGSGAVTVQNRPSEGSLRNVSNAILLTSTQPQTGQAAYLQFTPTIPQVLGGSLLSLSDISRITVADRGYFPVNANNLTFESIRPSNETLGEQIEQRFLTQQGTNSGWLNVSATNGASGRLWLSTVAQVSTIEVRQAGNLVNSLSFAENTQTNLAFAPMTNGAPVFASANLWDVRISEQIGSITTAGALTITGNAGATGEITIRVGNTERRVPISIAEHFVDIAGHWAAGYIRTMREAGVVSGRPTAGGMAFMPNDSLSRAEFSAMLSRLLQIDTRNYSLSNNHFVDNADIPAWARPYVAAMVSRGYISGRGAFDGLRFDPNAAITRAEAFTVLGRLLNTNANTNILNQFVDVNDIPAWGRAEIARLVAAGMLQGTDEGRLNPQNNLSRAEGATILARQSTMLLHILAYGIEETEAYAESKTEEAPAYDPVYEEVEEVLE